MDQQRRRIVCLCGSTRFERSFRTAEFIESVHGNIVLSVPVFSHAGGRVLTDEETTALAALHRAKIDLADEILVIDPGGYVGRSTRDEIAYAHERGKDIRYWSLEHPDSGPSVPEQEYGPAALVAECWRAQGASFAATPTLDVPHDLKELRCAIIEEEAAEFRTAVEAGDLEEVADAIADLLYVTYGAGLTFGIPTYEIFAEVHRSNMTKVGPDGEVHRRADGKIMKGPWFSPPRLGPILEKRRSQHDSTRP